MITLKSSLYAIALISILSGFINTFFQKENIHKYTKYIISLIIILSLFPSLITILSVNEAINIPIEDRSPSTHNIEESYKTTIVSATKDNLSNRFNITPNDFDVELNFSESNSEIILNNITITIKNKNINGYADRFKAYIQSSFGCSATIIQNLEE